VNEQKIRKKRRRSFGTQ